MKFNNLKSVFSFAIITSLLFLQVETLSTAYASALEKYASQPLNELAKEASPYLRLHSRDLVQWNSWSQQTLNKARQSGKPVFISIGYSACHWCHVMQEESFNNADVAKLLNQYFTPILIDREQRPDLDETYMLATEAMTGQGGWPNNVFLTPDLKPFYGGVYFPTPNYIKVLTLIATDWTANQKPIVQEADRIAAILTSYFNRKTAAKELDMAVEKQAASKIVARFDTFNGGMGTAPKHFNAPVLGFLVYMADKADGEAARQALISTLKAIAKGGVQDQLAGGFHRYATDNNWRIPHFEKMLYDQAMLAEIYVKAAALTGDQQLATTARRTLDYVLDDLTAPQGGFYATRDADSQGKEGTYYIWSPSQLTNILGKDDSIFLISNLGIISEGEFSGKIILHSDVDLSDQDKLRFNAILAKLTIARNKRPQPHKDKKIIASWNGLMISAFATAGQYLGDARYGAAAVRAADFIWQNMRTRDGQLQRNYFEGKAGIAATLPDYAFLANALVDVYDLTDDKKWLKRAEQLTAEMDRIFADKKVGDYYFTASKQGYARIRLHADSALPSGNAMAMQVLEKLSRRTLDPQYSRRAEALIAALSADAVADPTGGATPLAAAGRYFRGETGPVQYAARGRVKVHASLNKKRDRLRLHVRLAPNWHVNANKPFEDIFIPTSLSLKTASRKTLPVKVNYPEPVSIKLGFNEKPLSLYQNRFDITVPLLEPATSTIISELTLQACNDKLCLLPQTLTLKVTPMTMETTGTTEATN